VIIPGPTLGPGRFRGAPGQAKKTLTGLSSSGPLRSWLNRLRSGSGTSTWVEVNVPEGGGESGRFAASTAARALVRRITASAVSNCSRAGLDGHAQTLQGMLGEQL